MDDGFLESRRMAQFVAVAEAPSLAAAADRVFVTQQALSLSIRQLERELGVALFDRSRRHLRLTAAGEELLRGARPLLAASRRLATSVRHTAEEVTAPYAVAHSPALSGSEVFRLLQPAIAAHPDRSVTIRPLFPDRFTDELHSGDIDLVLRRGVETPPQLASAVIAYHRLRLAVHSSHPFARRRSVSVTELAEQPIIVWAPERRSYYTDFLAAHCRRSGFEPMFRINRIQGSPPASAVLADPTACAFVTEDSGLSEDEGVRVIEFDSPPMAPVQALWLPNTVSDFRSRVLSPSPDPRSPEDV